jgi:hypothetical protein
MSPEELNKISLTVEKEIHEQTENLLKTDQTLDKPQAELKALSIMIKKELTLLGAYGA